MSNFTELIYTVFLGWMRTVVDAFWALTSGRGGGAVLSWLLLNWKIWLVIIIACGIVADWLMWMIRWKPYRLLANRFGRKLVPQAAMGPAWDDGEGSYAADDTVPEWTEMTMTPLSELDAGWAGEVTMQNLPVYDETPYYVEETEGNANAQTQPVYDETPYYVNEIEAIASAKPVATWDFAEEADDTAVDLAQTFVYHKPSAWPFYRAQKESEPIVEPIMEPVIEPAVEVEPHRRRRRNQEMQVPPLTPKDWVQPDLPPGERAERLVTPVYYDEFATTNTVRTVTGKPAQRKGLSRFSTAMEEPIKGLPPMPVGDAFRPAARPPNPDFDED